MPYPNCYSIKGKSLQERIDLWEFAGYGFEASKEITLLAGGTNYTVFKTGSKPVILYSREISYDGIGFNALIYRNSSYTGGTSITDFRQASDIATSISECEIVTDATITNIGIETRSARYIFASTSNQASGDTIQVITTPQIIPPNQTLVLEIQNRDSNKTQNVASHLTWIEPESIPGLIIQNGVYVGYNGISLY